MKNAARISMILSVMLVLISGTVLQHHHHGDVNVCMCFNPYAHCKGHHHHHDTCADACSSLGHEAEGSHDDAHGCSLHLDYGLYDSHIDTPQPYMMAILSVLLEIDNINDDIRCTADCRSMDTIEGNRSIWFLRGPPVC